TRLRSNDESLTGEPLCPVRVWSGLGCCVSYSHAVRHTHRGSTDLIPML
ncbi:unnamed protein product, partial [Tilletia laevis]